MVHRGIAILPLCIGLLVQNAAGQGQWDLFWENVQLRACVTEGPESQYAFSGRLILKPQKLLGLEWKDQRTPEGWMTVSTTWRKSSQEAIERLELEGGIQGDITAKLKCSHDPWILPDTACSTINVKASQDVPFPLPWPNIYATRQRPLTSGQVEIPLASNASNPEPGEIAISSIVCNQGGQPPPPPPPGKKTVRRELLMGNIEGVRAPGSVINPGRISGNVGRGSLGGSRTIDRGSLQTIQRPGTREGAAVSVPVFRSPGGAKTSEGGETTPAPRALGADEMRVIAQALGAPEPGSLYARLTPSSPEVPGKGALVFVKADVVEGGEDYALFENNEAFSNPNLTEAETGVEGYFVLWLRSPPNRRYLIDCAVSGKYWHLNSLQGPEFRVAGPDGIHVFDFRQAFDAGGYHLTFGLEAGSAGWFPFQVSTLPAGMAQGAIGGSGPQNTEWRLHSCEATNL